jgi:hypothetical protein
MRHLRVLWTLAFLPVLLFAQSAEAARISFATENCGTPPLLDLQFAVDADTNTLSVLSPGGALCPTNTSFVPGAVSDSGGSLYGDQIDSIQFFIAATTLPTIELDSESDIEADLSLVAVSGGFLLTADFLAAGNSIPVCTGLPSTLLTCIPDIQIGIHDLEDYPGDATFRVIRVNDVSVPEPATLGLLGMGLAVAAVRRRRTTATKGRPSRVSSAPESAHRT